MFPLNDSPPIIWHRLGRDCLLSSHYLRTQGKGLKAQRVQKI